MLKIGIKIFHTFILLITLIALIGVNVKQLCCCHPDHNAYEIRLLPAKTGCPCEGRKCENNCRTNARYDFYKITDFSLIEQALQVDLADCRELELYKWVVPYFIFVPELYFWSPDPVPDLVSEQEFLCTYLC